MSKKRDNGLGERCRNRSHGITEADNLFAEAKESQARAEVTGLNAFWLQAAGLFARAARFYRQSNLGLSARESYLLAAECHEGAANTDEAKRCKAYAKAIQEYWEGNHE
ncbi:MAG: hypothetical protein EBT03_10760 [Betaproteobacteria bacterium]|nr:hypothetical protein [Betaproteobacteria bacterium]NCA17790.1 hypothetical protein [Betaproteobacteria bacterium]